MSRTDWTICKAAMWTATLINDPTIVLVAKTQAALMSKINEWCANVVHD